MRIAAVAFAALWLGLGFSFFYNFLMQAASQMTRDWIYGVVIVVLLLMVLFPRRRLSGKDNK